MTVAQLIKKLKAMPQGHDVCLLYDSQVMCVSVDWVGRWRNDFADKTLVVLSDQKPDDDDDRVQR